MPKIVSAGTTTLVAVLALMGAILTLREYSSFVADWGLYIIGTALILGLAAAMVALLSVRLRVYAINAIVLSVISLSLAATIPYLPKSAEPPLAMDAMSVFGAMSRGNPDEIRRYFDAGSKTDMFAWQSLLGSGISDESLLLIAKGYPQETTAFCEYGRRANFHIVYVARKDFFRLACGF